MALGDGGTQIICLEIGEVFETDPLPVVAGLEVSLTVAHSAISHGNLTYTCNGEAGIYLAHSRDDFNWKS